jgi:hypothetical protein
MEQQLVSARSLPRTEEVRDLIEALVRAQLDGTRVARRVMLMQEVADTAQEAAAAAFDAALARGCDDEAIDRAVATSSAATQASEDELQAAIAWKEHLEETDRLVRAAGDLLREL